MTSDDLQFLSHPEWSIFEPPDLTNHLPLTFYNAEFKALIQQPQQNVLQRHFVS